MESLTLAYVFARYLPSFTLMKLVTVISRSLKAFSIKPWISICVLECVNRTNSVHKISDLL